jgi:hypothetical protein
VVSLALAFSMERMAAHQCDGRCTMELGMSYALGIQLQLGKHTRAFPVAILHVCNVMFCKCLLLHFSAFTDRARILASGGHALKIPLNLH